MEEINYQDLQVTDEMIKKIALNIMKELKEDKNPESFDDLLKRLDTFINKTYQEYMDMNEYIKDLRGLYNKMLELLPEENSKMTILNLYFNNIDIIIDLRKKNNEQERLRTLKSKRKDLLTYIPKQQIISIKEEIKKENEVFDINFYIEFIEDNYDNNSYLTILPNTKEKESLLIIDTILTHYIKEINIIKYLLSDSNDIDYINNLNKYTIIYNNILNYKHTLISKNINEIKKENEILYYMYNESSYIYNDIKDYPEVYDSINMLINSIKTGNFKCIKYFTNNGKTKGLVEVRDLRNNTRVLFDVIGYKKYCIIGAIVGKKETNSIYKERLIARYSKYKLDSENYFKEDIKLTKVLRGANYE